MEHTVSVKRWRGKIHTADYMDWSAMQKWEKSIDVARALGEKSSVTEFYSALLPSALGMITKTEIKGLPENLTLETFPASPALCAAVVDIVTQLYRTTNEDEELPKLEGQSST